ncbi:MAG TPA: STAS domain-containing protein [Actinocrinis sp.]|jgi:anti-anti-sigma factor
MTGAFGPFALTVAMTGRALIVHACGGVDMAGVGTASAELLDAAATLPPPDLIVLNLVGVSFFSAAAAHTVRSFAASCAERGIRTHLVVDPGSITAQVVSLAGLDESLPTFSSVDQAL